MNWLSWLEVVLTILALVVATLALLPVVYQGWMDSRSSWPYRVVFRGRLKDPTGPWVIELALRVRNLTSQTAFFEIRLLDTGLGERLVPFHVSIWPKGDTAKFYAEIPPRVWREIRISPFGPQIVTNPATWKLQFTEVYHTGRAVTFNWPGDLNVQIEELATSIPYLQT